MSLNNDKYLGCHCLITLAPDCEIRLTSFHQALTYAGLMVGVPYKSANDDIIEALRKNAGLQYFNGRPPHLLPPPRRDYHKEPGDLAEIAETCTQSCKPEFLPAVACVAWFAWPGDFNDEPDEWIHAVMWFQDQFAMPIDANVLQQLRSLRWYQGATQIRLHAEQVSEGTLLSQIDTEFNADRVQIFFREKGIAVEIIPQGGPGDYRVLLPGMTMGDLVQLIRGSNVELI